MNEKTFNATIPDIQMLAAEKEHKYPIPRILLFAGCAARLPCVRLC